MQEFILNRHIISYFSLDFGVPSRPSLYCTVYTPSTTVPDPEIRFAHQGDLSRYTAVVVWWLGKWWVDVIKMCAIILYKRTAEVFGRSVISIWECRNIFQFPGDVTRRCSLMYNNDERVWSKNDTTAFSGNPIRVMQIIRGCRWRRWLRWCVV